MKRYKELKYNNKVFTEQSEIKEILFKEGFQWFLDCEMEDVRIEISKKHLIFNSGTFFNGTWKYGVFRDGVWKYGTWEGGVWWNGKWYDGIWKSGHIYDGKFYHGKIESGKIFGGEFYNIEISKDVIKVEKKEDIRQQNDQIPQGEKISENMKTKKRNVKSFNEFKINEEFDETELYPELTSDEFVPIGKDEIISNRVTSEFVPPIEDDIPPDSEDYNPDENPFIEDEDESPIDEIPTEDDFEDLPPKPVNPIDRAEQWKNLSSNPGGRKIFKTMNDYLNSIGVDTTKHEETPDKIPSTGKGIRRKK